MATYVTVEHAIRVANNYRGGVLLARLWFRLNRPHEWKDGKPWVTWRRWEWAQQIICSSRTVDEIIADLRAKGLIETETIGWREKKRGWVTLTEMGRARLELSTPADTKSPLQNAEFASTEPLQNAECAQLILSKSKKASESKKESEITNVISLASGLQEHPASDQNFLIKPEKEEEKEAKKASELSPESSSKSPPKSPPTISVLGDASEIAETSVPHIVGDLVKQPIMKPKGKVTLATTYRDAVITHHGGPLPPFNARQFSQLKHFEKRCPAESPMFVVAYCVEHWNSFTGYTHAHTGDAGRPQAPHIGYLLRYVGEAMRFSKAPQDPSEVMPVYVPEPVTVQPTLPKTHAPKKKLIVLI
jgi:hypothetical protein